jgi:hypothetical protein
MAYHIIRAAVPLRRLIRACCTALTQNNCEQTHTYSLQLIIEVEGCDRLQRQHLMLLGCIDSVVLIVSSALKTTQACQRRSHSG